MGSVRSAPSVKLFAAVLFADREDLPDIERKLVDRLGPVDLRSPILPFGFTEYYAPEMGPALERVLLSFEPLAEADSLAGLKLDTNAIEDRFRLGGEASGRKANIDPGYIEQSKVVLASTKNFYHRISLGHGIFAEVTMHFRNNTYQFFPWTYPDYKTKDYQQFFIRMRQIYRTQLKRMCLTENRSS